MTTTTGAGSNGGWTLINADSEGFQILSGPKDKVDLVHLIVPCDSSKLVSFAQVMRFDLGLTQRQAYGVNMADIMSRLASDYPGVERLYIQLSFDIYRTSIAEPAQFGSWVKAFVKTALAAKFESACPIFLGVTDIANQQFKVVEYIEALGEDKFGFFDDPAVTIMMRRGSAVFIGRSAKREICATDKAVTDQGN
ncbi:hypothetical protein CERZMDRAFT_89253 [Cercospora zeae-maydis SCOH1-5]|uniref:Uncharacterized protein n=1 Tax=Cercospora zeae-maydis SCOH1-5 TaxID=717836 RepID=A0A6A6EYF8_9PEZI|nr:hypothetical protein CERZMDRAFT_89253 [Cercospora zeae-maydis SCOH1-5]